MTPSRLRILDVPAVGAALDEALGATTGTAERRAAAVRVLGVANGEARAAIAAEVAARPREAYRAIHDYAWLTDQIVTLTLDAAARWMHPLANPTRSERIAALAVGGYGRAEMAPFSDVDLLFVTPYKQTPWGESLIETVLYCLWDLRLKVGHSARTVDDCLRLARGDTSIRTSLLEHRFVWGAEPLAERLDERLWTELFEGTGPEFVELKLAERATRHERQGSTRYLLEPNVKDGKGGLRDLQTLFWIGKYLTRARGPEDLMRKGFFTADEFTIFSEAAAFLWTTRVHLHLLCGRAIEQLTFDMQVEISAALGYRSTRGQRAVERFMQDYFTHAKAVGDLTRIFLSALEAQHVKPRPGLGRTLRNVLTLRRDRTAAGYRLKHGRLDVADPEAFLADPVNILRLFQEGLSTGTLIHPDALRLVAANLALIDDRLRNDPEANRIFLELLLGHGNPERALRLMNEVGVLGAFIPEFGRIVAMMQFNMYHHYTVDEHIIRTISTLSQIEQGDLIGDLPVSTEILARGVNRRVLYVALLLHDIAKGSGRDHSELGGEIALRLAPRFGLDADETEMVAWLVRNHLLMSDTAQKRDLAEPRTVRDFAQIVKSPNRLKLLTVLTVCDIRGVGPNVWNNWKAMLLRTLYAETLEYLTGGSQSQSRPEREAAAKSALAEALEGWGEDEIRTECARHYAPYWLGFDTRTHAIFADLVRRLPEGEPAIDIELDFGRDATQACFAMSDHPGIFARLAGALALAGANVVDARTYTSTDGIATAAFWIQDAQGAPYERARLARLRHSVGRTLRGEVVAREALKSRDRIKKREKDFVVPTRVHFDNTASDIYTLIEVETRDRPGLLYDLARTLTANSISIASAIIATYGKQAVDVFYVKDLFGLKLHAEGKRDTLEARLRAVIDQADGQTS
ncbi:[protein-PII] uridylyltransferase [Amaricoccus sp.]|uniref:[protein-PII] uridylyltransferase n=1 Tax=Amaricoccus sp. TaxID=1872485 RepID=UPI002B52DCD6|nr:[protein-PII] uridylyltransferase [Amaricoccus sp.]HRW14524.1 [protein-PII] uridylyltransferase [Amaricoccus sp.]